MQLVATRDLAARLEELTRNGPMLVQPYVEHSVDGCPTSYRVLTLFGRVLCCHLTRWAPPASLDEIAASAQGTIATNTRQAGCVRELSNDTEVIAFAEQAQAAFRSARSSASTWCVRRRPGSSISWRSIRKASPGISLRRWRERSSWRNSSAAFTFNALDRTAQLLIEKTRAAAS